MDSIEMDNMLPAIEPVEYSNGILRLLDQRELPREEVWLEIKTLSPVLDAIVTLAVRGAPLLGIVAGYGVLVGMREILSSYDNAEEQFAKFARVRRLIAETRPTARNLFGTLERIDRVVQEHAGSGSDELLRAIEDEAFAIHREERESCLRIGDFGAELLKNAKRVLTHCNTGVLATGGIGTALGAIHTAFEREYIEKVWVDETRPLLQGARLTAWELHRLGIPHSIICDNTAASLMQSGLVDAVITGADRIAANGDTANKIGTLNLAVLCSHFKIPFYIAAPRSTIDQSMASGSEIIVEQRHMDEIHGWGENKWACPYSDAVNPAFDVTPAELITAIITEEGFFVPPNRFA